MPGENSRGDDKYSGMKTSPGRPRRRVAPGWYPIPRAPEFDRNLEVDVKSAVLAACGSFAAAYARRLEWR